MSSSGPGVEELRFHRQVFLVQSQGVVSISLGTCSPRELAQAQTSHKIVLCVCGGGGGGGGGSRKAFLFCVPLLLGPFFFSLGNSLLSLVLVFEK